MISRCLIFNKLGCRTIPSYPDNCLSSRYPQSISSCFLFSFSLFPSFFFLFLFLSFSFLIIPLFLLLFSLSFLCYVLHSFLFFLLSLFFPIFFLLFFYTFSVFILLFFPLCSSFPMWIYFRVPILSQSHFLIIGSGWIPLGYKILIQMLYLGSI